MLEVLPDGMFLRTTGSSFQRTLLMLWKLTLPWRMMVSTSTEPCPFSFLKDTIIIFLRTCTSGIQCSRMHSEKVQYSVNCSSYSFYSEHIFPFSSCILSPALNLRIIWESYSSTSASCRGYSGIQMQSSFPSCCLVLKQFIGPSSLKLGQRGTF